MKNFNSSIVAMAVVMGTVIAPAAMAKGGAAIAPVKHTNAVCTKGGGGKAMDMVKKASTKAPLKIAHLEKKSAPQFKKGAEPVKKGGKSTVKKISKTK